MAYLPDSSDFLGSCCCFLVYHLQCLGVRLGSLVLFALFCMSVHDKVLRAPASVQCKLIQSFLRLRLQYLSRKRAPLSSAEVLVYQFSLF